MNGDAAAHRRRDLLLTAVMVGILLTPAWLLPGWASLLWQVGVVLLALPALWWSWRHAPWHPTPRADLERALTLLKLAPEQRFCDLGAGDGRVVLAAHALTGAHCVGIEVSPLPWLIGRLRLALQGGPATELWWADLYRSDLSRFDALYVWGTAYGTGTAAFVAHLEQHLRPGARVVSYHHPLPGLSPVATDTTGERPLYLYVPVPEESASQADL